MLVKNFPFLTLTRKVLYCACEFFLRRKSHKYSSFGNFNACSKITLYVVIRSNISLMEQDFSKGGEESKN